MCSQSVNLLRFCIILDPNASVRQQTDLLKTVKQPLFNLGGKTEQKVLQWRGQKILQQKKKRKKSKTKSPRSQAPLQKVCKLIISGEAW